MQKSFLIQLNNRDINMQLNKQFDYIKSTKQMIKGHDFVNGYFYRILDEGEEYSYDKKYPTYFSRRHEQEFLFLDDLYKRLIKKND